MIVATNIPAKPQHPLDFPQIKSFWRAITRIERPGKYRDCPCGSTVLGWRLADCTFCLIEKLQTPKRSGFERTEIESDFPHLLANLAESSSIAKT
ncbi:hypothetical protein [Bremerella cremea]|uniref:hypothetical protein n=1 Tax=Bremerella cremea TaxID=1031537 RepID=UPI0031E94C13